MSQEMTYEELDGAGPGADGGADLGRLQNVPVEVAVEIGRTRMTIGDALALGIGSVVTVGYQRAVCIGATSCHACVVGSKRFVSVTPVCGPRCPPAKSTRPSARWQCAEQKRSVVGFGTLVNALVVGFQTRAS